MAKDKDNMGGPTKNPNDPDTDGRENRGEQHANSAQSQSSPEGDDERRNREGASSGKRTGTQSGGPKHSSS